jgi:hypothetical protein
MLGGSVSRHQVISGQISWLIVVLTAVLVFVGSLLLGGSSEGSRGATAAKNRDKLGLGCLGNHTIVSQVWGAMTRSGVIMSKDCFLVVANVDGIINAMLWATSREDVVLESSSGVWCVSSITVPSIDYPVFDTKSNLLARCSFPDHLRELQCGLLLRFVIWFSCGEVVVLLSTVPFIGRLVRSEDLKVSCTFEFVLSTVLELCWSV